MRNILLEVASYWSMEDMDVDIGDGYINEVGTYKDHDAFFFAWFNIFKGQLVYFGDVNIPNPVEIEALAKEEPMMAEVCAIEVVVGMGSARGFETVKEFEVSFTEALHYLWEQRAWLGYK